MQHKLNSKTTKAQIKLECFCLQTRDSNSVQYKANFLPSFCCRGRTDLVAGGGGREKRKELFEGER